jgi:hypothetical protein
MSFSKPKKYTPKGTVRQLKIVQSVSRRGYDGLKTEEVKTPKKKAAIKGQQTHSSSPIKRPKLDPSAFDCDPIQLYLEGPDTSSKRRTLVCLFSS